MANVTMNVKQFINYLDTMEGCPERNIMVSGKHGIGKSEICTAYHQNKNRHVKVLFLGQMSDPGDLIGLPRLNPETQRTEFDPPAWFPTDDEPIVLFLDELNRARPEILQVIMDLALNKTLNGRPLPKGSRIISAVNNGNEYTITDLDPALLSRFAVVELKPEVSEWIEWSKKENKGDERVLDFISDNENMLDGADQSCAGLNKTPDRRAWTDVCRLLKNKEDIDQPTIDAIASMVGISAASAFNTWLHEEHLPRPQDVLLQFKNVRKSLLGLKLHEISKLNENLFSYMSTVDGGEPSAEMFKGLVAYAEFLADLPKKGREGTNKSIESFRHFQSMLLDDQNHKDLVNQILVKCPKIVDLFTKTLSQEG